jgi:hypothetical protein
MFILQRKMNVHIKKSFKTSVQTVRIVQNIKVGRNGRNGR